MATGDIDDIVRRLRSNLPPWFPTDAPVLDSILTGSATAFKASYDFYLVVKAQTRIATASGFFLDLIAFDFLPPSFIRRDQESDELFRVRTLREIFRERVTRKGIEGALQDLTRQKPQIVELWNAGDTGAYDLPQTLGYDAAGYLGDMDAKYDVLVRAFMPPGFGIPNVGGYDLGGGYDSGWSAYADDEAAAGEVSPEDIYGACERNRAAGVITWVQINPAGGVVIPVEPGALIFNDPDNSAWLLMFLLG